ncbi:MAG TPA: serine hydrolase domain-containing protein [Allosphingosinicella sp.]
MRLLLTILVLLLGAASSPTAARTPKPTLDAAIGAFAREHDFSGTILVADRGRTVYRRSFGLADRAFGIPAADSTRYKAASITKLFTSVLILQLHDQGKLDLQARAEAYLPELKGAPAGAVTVHQLLNHTSGLPQWDNIGSYQEAFAKGVERYQRPIAPADLVKLCCLGPLAAPPGTRFDYNNADYFILGRIVERLSGPSFEAALTERILRPLRMASSGMLHWDSIVERLAPTYFYRDDTHALINDLPVYYENWYAAAGMYSTAADLMTFADALYGGRLLKPATLERMLRPGLDDYGYGLWSYSVVRGGRSYRVAKRPGSVMGANSVLYRLLDGPATIVILANSNRADLDVFAQKIADVLLR